MKKSVNKGRCAHEGADGVCRKAGSNYRNMGCVGPKCPDRETCRHADREGRCANPEGQSRGAFCCVCEEFAVAGGAPALPAVEASRACAHAREGAALPAVTAEEVVTGYVAAVNGTLHIIRFGAMMMVLEACLTRETGGKPGDPAYGGGLKAWLAENVPDVNYKTAMRMKGTAETVCAGLGAEPSALLRCLNPDPKALPDEEDADELIALRDRLVEIVHGKSERSLVLWLKGGAPAAPAEAGEVEDTAKAEEAALDAAKRFARAAADALKCLDNRKKKTVAQDVAKALRDALGLKGLAWLAKVLEEAEQ